MNPVTRPGDLFILGDQVILSGDSTKPADIQRVFGGEKAALLSTDAPYCVDYTGNDRPIHDGKPSGKDWSNVYREVDIEDLGEFLDATFRACLPHVEDAAGIYLWHAHVQQPTVAACFERHGLLLHQVIVWVKPTATFAHSYCRRRHEPCAFGWKKGLKPTHGYGDLETVAPSVTARACRSCAWPRASPIDAVMGPFAKHNRSNRLLVHRHLCRPEDVRYTR